MPLEHDRLVRGHVDGRAGASARSATPPRWSQCAVRDRGSRRTRAPVRASSSRELRRVAARIDHDGLRRAALGADDVAVRPDRAELVAVDGEAHGALSLTVGAVCAGRLGSRPCRAGTCARSRRPAAAARPVVLRSRRGARAVLIGLEPGPGARRPPGQGARLGRRRRRDACRVEAGGETVEAGPGLLFSFEPDERRSIASDGRRADPAPARAVARRGPLPRRADVSLARPRALRLRRLACARSRRRWYVR